MSQDKDKKKRTSILASFRSTGKHDKDKKSRVKPTQLGEVDEDYEADAQPQQQYNWSEMSESEMNKLMEQMLDDMNLSEEKKAPLRKMKSEQKKSHVGEIFTKQGA